MKREETYAQRAAREEAQERVVARFWPSWKGKRSSPADACEAIDVISSALIDQDQTVAAPGILGFPEIRSDDALDALQAVPEAIAMTVRGIEYTEMKLIETARRFGVPWSKIGERYGYKSQPGVHALRRYRTLRKQWPGHVLDPEVEAVVNTPDGASG